MFNLFNKKKEQHPISTIFNDLSSNQKMSIFNLLTTIASCDGNDGDFDIELKFLNVYIDILDINGSKCTRYLQSHGLESTISDLKSISQKQKEIIVIIAWKIVICDGRPNAKEINAFGNFFKAIGIEEEQQLEIIAKNEALNQSF